MRISSTGRTIRATRSSRATGRKPSIPAKFARESVGRFISDLVAPIAAERRLSELILFHRQMEILLHAGISVREALVLRADRAPAGRFKVQLEEAAGHLIGGGKLSSALARHPETFSEFQVAMVYAGEEGGCLDEAFGQIADTLEAELRLRRFINRQTLYAKITYVSAAFALPAFLAFVAGGSVIGVLYDSFVTVAGVILAFCLVFAVGRAILSRSGECALFYEQVKWALPGIGRVARTFAFCRFSRSLASLFRAGAPIQTAIRVAGRASGSRQVLRAAEEMAGYAEHGVSLDIACRATSLFPESIVAMVATGAESGRVDSMLLRLADYLEQDAETYAHQTGYVIAQVFYLIVALIVTGLIRQGAGVVASLLPV